MKGHISKQTFKLIGATSVAIFSLIAVFTATAAWFEASRTREIGANEMQVHKMDFVSTLTIYEPVFADATHYYFSTTPAVVGEDTVPLGGGESIFKADDPYHPLLIVIDFSGAVSNTDIYATTESTFICDTQAEVSANPLTDTDGNPLSSIVSFYTAGFASTIPTITYNAQSVYGFTSSDLAT